MPDDTRAPAGPAPGIGPAGQQAAGAAGTGASAGPPPVGGGAAAPGRPDQAAAQGAQDVARLHKEVNDLKAQMGRLGNVAQDTAEMKALLTKLAEAQQPQQQRHAAPTEPRAQGPPPPEVGDIEAVLDALYEANFAETDSVAKAQRATVEVAERIERRTGYRPRLPWERGQPSQPAQPPADPAVLQDYVRNIARGELAASEEFYERLDAAMEAATGVYGEAYMRAEMQVPDLPEFQNLAGRTMKRERLVELAAKLSGNLDTDMILMRVDPAGFKRQLAQGELATLQAEQARAQGTSPLPPGIAMMPQAPTPDQALTQWAAEGPKLRTEPYKLAP